MTEGIPVDVEEKYTKDRFSVEDVLVMLEGESFARFYNGIFEEYIEMGAPDRKEILLKVLRLLPMKNP